jgi:peptide deformylase
MSLELIYYPHPVLRHPSKPLKKVDSELRKMIAEMLEIMYKHQGVGLAANQVGLPYRLFVANPEGDPKVTEAEHVFINPVLRRGKGSVEGEEGCLSIPDVRAPVTRHESIEIEAFDLAGNEIHGELNGMFARIAQHEVDHLDGVLFIDRLSPTQLAEARPLIEEFELDFESKRKNGAMASDEDVAAQLAELEKLRT